MRKRRREEHHEEEERYSLPMPKAKKRTQSATFKPNINDFHIIINEAIKSKLYSIIKATLKNNPESDIKDLKKTDVSAIEINLSKLAKPASSKEIDIKKQYNCHARERNALRLFYNARVSSRERITAELFTRRTKDRVAAKERRFVKGKSEKAIPVMAIGNSGTGVGSPIKGYDRRGGKWLEKLHSRYVSTIMTDEYMTSQLCLYCYFPIAHPRTLDNKKILGTSRCLNPDCPAFKHGRATNNRDVMSAAAIGVSAMTKVLYKQNFPPFSKH